MSVNSGEHKGNIGDDAGECPQCSGPTKVSNYDEAPWGFRGNYSYECAKCGRFYWRDGEDNVTFEHPLVLAVDEGLGPSPPVVFPCITFQGIQQAPADPDALLDEPPEVSEEQCICCVSGGDTSKKTCTYRCETGTDEGWWCDECYNDFRLNDQDSPQY